MHSHLIHCCGTIVDNHLALSSLGVGSNLGGLVAGGYGNTVHRNLPPVGHFVSIFSFHTCVLLHRSDWFVRCSVSAIHYVGTRSGMGNGDCTCTAWGSSEAIVCLFLAVFLLCPWFDQLWGVSLNDPLTPA